MAKINVEKIKNEFSKGNPDEIIEAWGVLKEYVTAELTKAQQALDEKSNQLSTTLQKINPVVADAKV